MFEINHPYSGNEWTFLLMWFRGIRASDTRLRSASAFQPPLPVHPLLLILSLALLLPPPLTEFLSSPQTTPPVFTLLKSISKADGSLLEFLQRLPKANSWKLSSQTFMTLFLWHLNVAHVSRLEDNPGSLWKADLWASPKGVIIQYQVQDPGFFSSPWGLPCDGWSTPGGALPFHPTAWRNLPWARSLHSVFPKMLQAKGACQHLLPASSPQLTLSPTPWRPHVHLVFFLFFHVSRFFSEFMMVYWHNLFILVSDTRFVAAEWIISVKWNSGKCSTCLCVESLSSIWLCDPLVCSPPGSSVHLQARILEWVAIFFSRGSFWPSDWTCISCTGRQGSLSLSHQGRPKCSSVQSLSCVWLFATPWTAARQASLSITNSRSLLKLMSIESVMPSNNLILCHPLLLPPSILPSIRVFQMSQFFTSVAKVLEFQFQLQHQSLPMNIQDWSLLEWTGWISLQSKGLSSLLQHHSSKASMLRRSAFFIVQLSHPYMTTGKTKALSRWIFVGKVMSLLFNMLSRLVIAFLPRSKSLLISWLQSPSAVIYMTSQFCFQTDLPLRAYRENVG